jgi:hypothetical protein
METIVKERPILFSGPMVQALLAGIKTQTRRALRPEWVAIIDEVSGKSSNTDGREDEVTISYLSDGPDGAAWYVWLTEYFDEGVFLLGQGPYGQPGDRLWVRESCAFLGERVAKPEGAPGYVYRADSNEFDGHGIKWKPSIHMPRVASRLLLEIVSVRVERLQDISEADAVAEGIMERYFYGGHQSPGHVEWESVQPPYGDGKQRPLGTYADYSGGRAHLKPIESYASLWRKINGPDSWAANPWVWVVEFKVIEPASPSIKETPQTK